MTRHRSYLDQVMKQAQVSRRALSDGIDVSPKTVDRWMAGSASPRTEKRFAVANFLGVDVHQIWPDDDAPIGGGYGLDEVAAAYPRRADAPKEAWWRLIERAETNLDFLGFAIQFLPEDHPKLMPSLAEKAERGCTVRIVVCDPDSHHVTHRDGEEGLQGQLAHRIRTSLSHFQPVLGVENIEIRYQDAPMYNSIFRFDNQMFVTPHLYGNPGYMSPLFHLRRLGSDGVFDSFAGHFDRIWQVSTSSNLEP